MTDSPLKPLNGRLICVTRAESQAGDLIASLTTFGASVLAVPAIEIVAPDDEDTIREAVENLARYAWIIFTSTNAVDRFFDYMVERRGIDSIPAGVKCACVGSATAASLAKHNVAPAIIPHDYKAEGLIEEFQRDTAALRKAGLDITGQEILMPRAQKAREILPEFLRELGYDVVVAPVYQTVPATLTAEQIVALEDGADNLDAVTFTSPSTVRNFFTALENASVAPLRLFEKVVPFSIGSVTTDTLVQLGVARERVIEAHVSTTKGLIETLQNYFAKR